MRVPCQRDRDDLEIKMTPMIDVVFLLLIFFLWTSSFEKPEFSMPSALAEPPAIAGIQQTEPDQIEPFDEIVIHVAWDSANIVLTLNQNRMESMEALTGRLTTIAELGVQPPVIVDPDAAVPIGYAIEIYDLVRRLNFDRVLFAADSQAESASGL